MHVARIEGECNAYRILVRRPVGKRPLGKSRHRRENCMNVNLRETGRECVDWIHLAQDMNCWLAVVNTVVNFHKRRGIS